MKTKVSWGIIFLLILCATGTKATENTFAFPTRTFIEQAIEACTESYGPLVRKEGEILAVEADQFSFGETDSGERIFSLCTAEVFVNGRAGSPAALRPVAPGFNFAARLYFDHKEVLRLVDGWYVGAEAKVLTLDPGRGILTAQPLDHAQTCRLMFAPHLPAPNPPPTPGETCFLLFDWEQRVRKIIRNQ